LLDLALDWPDLALDWPDLALDWPVDGPAMTTAASLHPREDVALGTGDGCSERTGMYPSMVVSSMASFLQTQRSRDSRLASFCLMEATPNVNMWLEDPKNKQKRETHLGLAARLGCPLSI